MVMDIEHLRPLRDRVLVRRRESVRKITFGIVIQDVALGKPYHGEVIAVGPGEVIKDGRLRPLYVKAWDKVLFGKYAGQAVKVGREELVVMREDDIIAVL